MPCGQWDAPCILQRRARRSQKKITPKVREGQRAQEKKARMKGKVRTKLRGESKLLEGRPQAERLSDCLRRQSAEPKSVASLEADLSERASGLVSEPQSYICSSAKNKRIESAGKDLQRDAQIEYERQKSLSQL